MRFVILRSFVKGVCVFLAMIIIGFDCVLRIKIDSHLLDIAWNSGVLVKAIGSLLSCAITIGGWALYCMTMKLPSARSVSPLRALC